jgi:hypothetical protein
MHPLLLLLVLTFPGGVLGAVYSHRVSRERDGAYVSVAFNYGDTWNTIMQGAPWVDLHYRVNAGQQLDVPMRQSDETTTTSFVVDNVALREGQVLHYTFTYANGEGGAYDTAWLSYTQPAFSAYVVRECGVVISNLFLIVWLCPPSSRLCDVHAGPVVGRTGGGLRAPCARAVGGRACRAGGGLPSRQRTHVSPAGRGA